MSKKYDHKSIEAKWAKYWQEQKTYQTTEDKKKEKCYILDMFPYPSGDGLHVGHPKGFVGTDVFSRFKRMNGFNVLHPMGWDAFGLPAENYALKNKVHPRVAVEKNIERFKGQLSLLGLDYDWDREINTTDPAYYKWTQWIFLKLYEKGLAYVSHEPINWCPSCKTGLANEDLEGGKCERCGSTIEKKPVRQWVLKITDYADRMLDGLADLDWPDFVKEMQRNWIGRSEGLLFTAKVKDSDIEIQTFSAHFEAAYADTFVVIAPDHALLASLLDGVKDREEIQSQIDSINVKRMEGKYEGTDDVEGVFTGRYLVDPLGNGDLPIWVASFAIADYGTGIVKCSAHDERDFAFAKKYKIPLKVAMVPKDKELRTKVENFEVCFNDLANAELLEPAELAGTDGAEATEKMIKHLEKKGWAEPVTKYRLNDWVFSRQRYWGEPIPMLYCKGCYESAGDAKRKKMREGFDYTKLSGEPHMIAPLAESDLPLELPDVKQYEPTGTGESPLAGIDEWVKVKCPECQGEARRETNTMPQWAGSSWYYLRYMDADNDKELVSKKREKLWAPVDHYVGGLEHVTRHIIYARFWHKFLKDIGVVSSDEPFQRFQNVGMIAAEDGRKMSKRWGNVINPDDMVEQFGADTFRVYQMFLGPLSDGARWQTDAMMGPRRFLEKVWRLRDKIDGESSCDENLNSTLHSTIKKITADYENFRFNTAVSSLMILANEMNDCEVFPQETYESLLLLLAPLAPHITEELWHELGNTGSIHLEAWPKCDESKIVQGILELPVQINGKVRDTIYVSPDTSEEEIKRTALGSEKVGKWLDGKDPKKVIVVAGKIVSIVL